MSVRKNLIVVRAGKNSLHPSWINGGNPNFDLLVAAYDKNVINAESDSVRSKFIPGSKVSGWNILMRDHIDFIRRYDRVALIDDDIFITTDSIDKCFDIGKRYDLSIWKSFARFLCHICCIFI
jgi:hypothetical protein